MVHELLRRLNYTLARGLTDMPPAPIRSNLPHYNFTVEDWGIADLDYDGTDANDLNHKLSFFLFQFHYCETVQVDTQDMIRLRFESLARHLKSIGIRRRAPLDFFAGVVTKELNLTKPLEVPADLVGELEQ